MTRLLAWFFLQRPEPRAPIVFMPLADAHLCNDLDCGTVSNCARACPICFSHTHPISAFLDREVETTQ